MKATPDVNISLSGGGSSDGIKAIIDESTDLANASRFIKGKEVKLANEKGVYPVPFAVAYDFISPVVHSSKPISEISLAQLKDIYMGKVTNSKEMGGLI
jgi:phosphate transport system substrate-binding protein